MGAKLLAVAKSIYQHLFIPHKFNYTVFKCALQLKIATLDPTNNIARDFLSWLTGSGGGLKSNPQAQQIVSKCLKFLKFCCEDEEELHLTLWTLVYVHRISFSSLLIRCRMIGIWDTRDA